MFGYITPSFEDISTEEQARYHALYCGLCRSIEDRYGQRCRTFLTYELAFLVLLYNSLYEPEETAGSGRCLMHPLEQQDFSRSTFSDYAADLSIAFAYHKCLDDWQDDRSLKAKAGVELLKTPYEKARERIPKQCAAIEKALADISAIQRDADATPDDAAKRFGSLMGFLFAINQDFWARALYDFGYDLGRFIYFMDAAMDYDDDLDSGNYNPFKQLELELLDMRILLEGVMGNAVESFEKLPLVQDVHLLRSILYAGVWQKFNVKYQDDSEAVRSDGMTMTIQEEVYG